MVPSLRNISVILLVFRDPGAAPLPPLSSSTTAVSARASLVAEKPFYGLMLVAGRQPHVAHRKHNENDRLDDADDGAERVEGQRNHQLRQTREDAEHRVVGEHVGVKTDAEREGSKQVVRQLDRQHQRRKEKHRSQKALQISHTSGLETLEYVIAEADRAQAEGQIRITRRRLHTRYQPEEIREQDEHEDAAEERNEAAPVMVVGNLAHEAVQPLDHHLGNRAEAYPLIGNHGIGRAGEPCSREQPEDDQDSHHDPGTDDDFGNLSAADKLEEIY